MFKGKSYTSTRFRSQVFAEADQAIVSAIFSDTQLPQSTRLRVCLRDEFYKFDTVADFLTEVEHGLSMYHRDCGHRWGLEVLTFHTWVKVEVWAPTRSEIDRVFAIFDKYAPESKLSQTLLKYRPMIFIGHRADPQWRELRNELHEQHGYEVADYQIADRGLALRVVADDLVQGRSIAVLVMAADDELPEGKMRAREHLVYEAGVFVGQLGFGRTIVLLEEGAEELHDLRGVYQIRFAKGRVREAVPDVLDIVKREFEA